MIKIYKNYKCGKCGERFSVIKKYASRPKMKRPAGKAKCPSCGFTWSVKVGGFLSLFGKRRKK